MNAQAENAAANGYPPPSSQNHNAASHYARTSAVATARGASHFATSAQAAMGALLQHSLAADPGPGPGTAAIAAAASGRATGALLIAQNSLPPADSAKERRGRKKIAYSWDKLKLGEVSGTVALNNDLERKHKRRKVFGRTLDRTPPTLSTQQVLRMAQSLRSQTCLPPAGSILFSVVQHTKAENELWYGEGEQYSKDIDDLVHERLYGDLDSTDDDDDDDGEEERKAGNDRDEAQVASSVSADVAAAGAQDTKLGWPTAATEKRTSVCSGPVLPYTALARTYEIICDQEVDDCGAAFRDGCNYLRANDVVKQLRSLESTFVELEGRERDATRIGKELGILQDDVNEEMCRIKGKA